MTPIRRVRTARERSVPPRGRFAERAFAVLALMTVSGAFIPLLQFKAGIEIDVSTGDRTTQTFLLPIYLVSGAWLARHPRQFRAVVTRHAPSLVLIGLAVASVTWSAMPDVTLRRSIALAATTVFAAYLVARFDTVELLQVLAWTFGLSAVLSLATAIAFPSYGIAGGLQAGAWRGIYVNKNVLGRAMVLSTMVFALLAKARPERWWVLLPGALLSAGLVLLSRSGTALTVLIGMIVLLPLFAALRARSRVLPFLLAAAVLVECAVLLAVSSEWKSALSALGKNATLTGRTAIWTVVLERIAERPWLGYGYAAFWTGWGGESAAVWRAVGWKTPHSHNGFLDLWLDLGLVGVLICLAGLAVATRHAVATARATRTAEGLWPLAIVVFVVLYNLTESALLRQNSIFWVLYATAVFSAAAHSRAHVSVERRAGRAGDGQLLDRTPGRPPTRAAAPGLSLGVRLRVAWTGAPSSSRHRRLR